MIFKISIYLNKMRVVKRTGETVAFDSSKILNAITKALTSSGESNRYEDIENDAQKVTLSVCEKLQGNHTVEEIQDEVEKSLMENHFYKTAKIYILYRVERTKIRPQLVDNTVTNIFHESSNYFDNDTMREFVFLRTYSRWIPSLNRRESWIECVQRFMDFMKENLGNKLSNDEYNEVQTAILKQEVMPSMRLLQFAGDAARRCNATVYNCSYTAPENFKDLADIIYLCSQGCGVGYTVESVHVQKFPIVQKQKEPAVIHNFVVDDSKEGWADSFEFGLNAWYSGEDVVYDYSKLRPNGAKLKTSGGRASGPQALIDLMIFTRDIILKSVGSKLTTLQMYDIICKIGQIVVSGGNRRTAMLSLSDFKDRDIRDAKKGEFWVSNPQRFMANNSAAYNVKPTMTEFMREWLKLAESGTGERGIFNRSGLEKIVPQRRIDAIGIDALQQMGCNPCGASPVEAS